MHSIGGILILTLVILLDHTKPLSNISAESKLVQDSLSPCPANDLLDIDSGFDSFTERSMRSGLYFITKMRVAEKEFYIEAQPGEYIAIYATDSTQLFRRQICSPLDGGINFKITRPDLNFDGQQDVLLSGKDGGIAGNSFSIGFLYNLLQQTFQQNPQINLENLTVDADHKWLRSRHYASVYSGNWKKIYGWQGDSLVLMGQAVIQTTNDEKTKVRWEVLRNGAFKADSLTREDPDRAWYFFKNELLWKGDWEID